MISVRSEEPKDYDAVRSINLAAFEGGPEAALVDSLRTRCSDHVLLVAEEADRVVGHIFFTPLIVESPGRRTEGTGLAPMAVAPERQRCGMGSLLVRRGLDLLRQRSCPWVVVLGHSAVLPPFRLRACVEIPASESVGWSPRRSLHGMHPREGVDTCRRRRRQVSGRIRRRDVMDATDSPTFSSALVSATLPRSSRFTEPVSSCAGLQRVQAFSSCRTVRSGSAFTSMLANDRRHASQWRSACASVPAPSTGLFLFSHVLGLALDDPAI